MERLLKVTLMFLTVVSALCLAAADLPHPAQAAQSWTTLYDFVANGDKALWRTFDQEHGKEYHLVFNVFGSEKGTAAWRNYPVLEDKSRPTLALDTHPIWVDQGYIEGFYGWVPQIKLQPGDRFTARVGFREGAGAGEVDYQVTLTYYAEFTSWEGGRLSYGTKPKHITKSVHDTYDGKMRTLQITVPEEGTLVGLTLRVFAGRTSAQDWAHWAEARLERPSEPYLQVRSVHSKKCLDVDISKAPKANETKVQQWDCLGPGQTNQLWRFTNLP